MVCPMRRALKNEVEVVNGVAVIKGWEEYYPECYEGKCPYYTYPDTCEAVNKDLEE